MYYTYPIVFHIPMKYYPRTLIWEVLRRWYNQITKVPPPPQLTDKWTFGLQKCISIYHYIPRSIVLLAGGRVTGGRIHLGNRSILPRQYLFICALTIVLSTFQQRVYWWSGVKKLHSKDIGQALLSWRGHWKLLRSLHFLS